MSLFDLAMLPVVLLLVMVYRKDNKKEPMGLLVGLFFLGVLSCLLTLFISGILMQFVPFMQESENPSSLYILLDCFFGIALIEEFSKWIMVYLKGYNHQEFDELYDGIIYAIFVSLGFAAFENLGYSVIGGYATAFVRGFTSIPGHASFGLFMGYYLSMAKVCNYEKKKDKEKKYLLLSLVVPMMLHGTYDYCVMSGNSILYGLFFVFVIVLFIVAFKRLKYVATNNKVFLIRNNFCPRCGHRLTENKKCLNCQNTVNIVNQQVNTQPTNTNQQLINQAPVGQVNTNQGQDNRGINQ